MNYPLSGMLQQKVYIRSIICHACLPTSVTANGDDVYDVSSSKTADILKTPFADLDLSVVNVNILNSLHVHISFCYLIIVSFYSINKGTKYMWCTKHIF